MTIVWKKWMTAIVLSFAFSFSAYLAAVTAPNNDTALQAFHIMILIIFIICSGVFGAVAAFGYFDEP